MLKLRSVAGVGIGVLLLESIAISPPKMVPAPWMGWVAGTFFGQRYRACFALPSPRRFARLRVERLPGLPPDLTIAVQQIEVQR